MFKTFIFLCRRVKTSFARQRVCKFPSYEDLSKHWKEKIIVEPQPLYEKDTDIVIGMYYDPVTFIPKNMSRWLECKELEGKPLPPGSYDLRFKVSSRVDVFIVSMDHGMQ